MSRRIAIRTKSAVRFYDLASTDRPLTVISGKIYRSDEGFMVYDLATGNQFALYDLDGVVPYAVQNPPSQDETMDLIDIARGNKNAANKVGSGLLKKILKNLPLILIGGVVLWYVATKLMGA